jgi:hypothetical protein
MVRVALWEDCLFCGAELSKNCALGVMMLHRESSCCTAAAAAAEDRIVAEHVKGEDRRGIVFGAVGCSSQLSKEM